MGAAKPDRSTQAARSLLTLADEPLPVVRCQSSIVIDRRNDGEQTKSVSLERNGIAGSVNSLLVIPKLKESGFTGHI